MSFSNVYSNHSIAWGAVPVITWCTRLTFHFLGGFIITMVTPKKIPIDILHCTPNKLNLGNHDSRAAACSKVVSSPQPVTRLLMLVDVDLPPTNTVDMLISVGF